MSFTAHGIAGHHWKILSCLSWKDPVEKTLEATENLWVNIRLLLFLLSQAKPTVGAPGKGTGRHLKEVSRCGLLVQKGCEETGEAWTGDINTLRGQGWAGGRILGTARD